LSRTFVCAGQCVVKLEIRQRSARVAVLQEVLDRMRQVIVARAYHYAYDPVGATGMMVKHYRCKSGEREIWRFDAPLVSQINDVLGGRHLKKNNGTRSRTPTHQNGCA
jgi:hypothetical protein